MAFVEELQDRIRSVADRAGGSVVGVGRRWGAGTGVVVSPGMVLTNAHNIGGADVAVTFGDGRTAEGTAVGVDRDGDLAVLSVEAGDAPTIQWAEEPAALGTPVFAVANPGGRGRRVTFGVVSGTDIAFRGPRGRKITGAIEHTAPLPRGSSGSPLVDADGRLLGINTNRVGEGFYLAIPADAGLRDRVEALSRGESRPSPRLGVAVAPASVARRMRRAVGLPERDGLLVRQVEDGSPAAAGGIQPGDLIVEADAREIGSADDLYEALESAQGRLSVTVVRGTEERRVAVSFDGGEAAQEA